MAVIVSDDIGLREVKIQNLSELLQIYMRGRDDFGFVDRIYNACGLIIGIGVLGFEALQLGQVFHALSEFYKPVAQVIGVIEVIL